MRLLSIIIVLALSACASRPDDSRYYYQGVYAPGGVEIADNGAFAARATVWNAGHAGIASEAAYYRLEEAARTHGYTHVAIDDVVQTAVLGHQYLVTGMLYSRDDDAAGTVMISELRHMAANGDSAPRAEPVVASRKPAPVRAVIRPSRPVAAPQPPVETIGDPVVIQAPEFISSLESGDPAG